MAKRSVTLKTNDGTLQLRVSFNAAAAFEEATGVSVYEGDTQFLRSPSNLRKLVYLAAVEAGEDVTEQDVGDLLDGGDFQAVIDALTRAIYGDQAADEAKVAAGGKPKAQRKGAG